MPDRLTILMQNTTNPENATAASAHTAGWSESFYSDVELVGGSQRIIGLLTNRANMLPSTARIVGYRIAKFTISGNKLIPNGTQTVRYSQVGNQQFACDVPNMSLMFSASGVGVANASRFAARCIPDSQVVNGEYQPTQAFTARVNTYIQRLATDGWGFVGRKLDANSWPLRSIDEGVVTVVPGGAMAGPGSYVRFFRAKDDFRNPIEGAYEVIAADPVTRIYTLRGFPASIAMTLGNGLVRQDIVEMYTFTAVGPNRIVVRKVGRPFESYRGRRSNRAR